MTYQEQFVRDRYANVALSAGAKAKASISKIREVAYLLAMGHADKHEQHLRQIAAKAFK